MKLFSYVVARDFGFAPNPFHGVCTLATCKPDVRKLANVGDWVIGTGSATYGLSGKLVYAMEVNETLTFNEYWMDPRFSKKRPILNGSLKQAFGDNIYSYHGKKWIQANSHHSFANGRQNTANIKNDTRTNRILVSRNFGYWGADAPLIPARFRKKGSKGVCIIRGFKYKFTEAVATSFIEWLHAKGLTGYSGAPAEFP
jgi:hypothetical protein